MTKVLVMSLISILFAIVNKNVVIGRICNECSSNFTVFYLLLCSMIVGALLFSCCKYITICYICAVVYFLMLGLSQKPVVCYHLPSTIAGYEVL